MNKEQIEQAKKESIRLHREMWSWLAKTGKDKEDWPEWEWNGGLYGRIMKNCFLCSYVFEILKKDIEIRSCRKYCPLKWPDKYCAVSSILTNKQFLFDKWQNETDIEKRKEYAETIALLDEK